MVNVSIDVNEYKGRITIPPSKSLSHRGIMAAALANGQSTVENLIFSKDIDATIGCMENLGIKVIKGENSVQVQGTEKLELINSQFYCNESGSTLRFIIPIAMVTGGSVTFHGEGRLTTRPLTPYFDIFDEKEINYIYDNALPLTVNSKIEPGHFKMPGNVSSQFITGLLYALPLLQGDSTIEITTELESKGYVDLTLEVLEKFGVAIENNSYKTFHIKGNQSYKAVDYRVDGDYSQAAFWIVAGLIGGEIELLDLLKDSRQGDREIVKIAQKMGGSIEINEDNVKVERSVTKGIDIDVSEIPDLLPILAVLGSLSEGTTRLYNGERVRIKESDRIKAISTELKKLGADIEETHDGLIIHGKPSLNGGEVDSWNDHRIAMALSVAAVRCDGPVTITDAMAVEKSYPHFYEDVKRLGGKVDERCLGE